MLNIIENVIDILPRILRRERVSKIFLNKYLSSYDKNPHIITDEIHSDVFKLAQKIRRVNEKFKKRNKVYLFLDYGIEMYGVMGEGEPLIHLAQFQKAIRKLGAIFIERIDRENVQNPIIPIGRRFSFKGLPIILYQYISSSTNQYIGQTKKSNPNLAKTIKKNIQDVINLRNGLSHDTDIEKANEVIRNWFKEKSWMNIYDVTEWDVVMKTCLKKLHIALDKLEKAIN